MADGGYLAPPSKDPTKEKIWVETRKRLERFLPNLFAEIFPDNAEELPQQPTTAPPAVKATATSPATPDVPNDVQPQPESPASSDVD
jgi:brefeldin A-resistance guanine nucleotide exchange factor 1